MSPGGQCRFWEAYVAEVNDGEVSVVAPFGYRTGFKWWSEYCQPSEYWTLFVQMFIIQMPTVFQLRNLLQDDVPLVRSQRSLDEWLSRRAAGMEDGQLEAEVDGSHFRQRRK